MIADLELELTEAHGSIRREWILGFNVSTLGERFRIQTGLLENGPLSWAVSGQLIACSDKNVLSIEPEMGRVSTLPFQADDCCCHPINDICAFASRVEYRSNENPALSNVFIVRLTDFVTVTEQLLPGYVGDMCWSVDGKKLYVVTSEGDLWTCSFPEIP